MGTPIHRLVRGRGLRWAATVVLAVIAAAVATASVQRAEAARAAFGEIRRVPVATGELALGLEVADADVAWVDLPVVLIPAGVAEAPVGRVVTEPIAPGEVVLERRVSADADSGAAVVGAGHRALAVPVEAAPPGLEVGDRVDAYAPGSSVGSLAEVARGQGAGARRLTRDALVVAVDDRVVTIAVEGADATAVAGGLLDGAVVLALVGAG